MWFKKPEKQQKFPSMRDKAENQQGMAVILTPSGSTTLKTGSGHHYMGFLKSIVSEQDSSPHYKIQGKTVPQNLNICTSFQ